MRKVSRRIILKLTGVCLLLISSGKIICQSVPDSVLLEAYSGGISYLALNQLRGGHTGSDYTGEWPTFIYNTSYIPFLGKKGKSAYDSNVFNTLFIHNTLSELYLARPDSSVLTMLSLAQKNFIHYRNEGSFNFWPLLERPAHLKCNHQNCRQRRPVNFDYHYGFINNYANIYDDADDTSAGLLAYYYSSRIRNIAGDTTLIITDINSLLRKFVMYRDTGKRKTNWYNKRLGFNYRTGAYLTWFGPDRKHANFFSWFFPAHKTQNILYGRNEVDCVVNANVLRAMAVTGNTAIPGVSEAKAFLRQVVSKKVCFTCGVYYPTEFTFHYAMARAINSGVNGFDDLKKNLVQEILTRMNEKGYWESEIEDNDMQATLYAVNALMLLDDNDTLRGQVNRAMNYVIGNRVRGGTITHWPAGVFFSGGSAIRYNHIWRSEAYTTALALEAITNYLRQKKKA
jgi:hypothetical protein